MTETDLLAKRARVGLLDLLRPMAPDIALDMVQDATGDRGAALRAIRGAFAGWLLTARPDICAPAGDCVDHLDHGELAHAEEIVATLREWWRSRLATERDLAADWLRWCSYADRDLTICRALTEAANPVGAV